MNPSRLSLHAFVLAFALGAVSARAESVTYNFIEAFGGSGVGVVGGSLTLASPPASSSSNWSMAATGPEESNILDFEILDSKIGVVGSYLYPQFFGGLASTSSGQTITSGDYGAYSAPGNTFPSAFTYVDAFEGYSQLGGFDADENSIGSAYGSWELAVSSVPEPSTFVLGLLGLLGGAGYFWRQRASF